MTNQVKTIKDLDIGSSSLNKLLIEARVDIATLKGACFGLPNPQLLLSPTVMREALASSEVENIVTTLEDVLQAQLFPEAERSQTDKEVIRYNQALTHGIEMMNSGVPIGSRLIKGVHDTLVETGKGYRKTQNALRNEATGEIVYMPPEAQNVAGLIADLEKYIHTNNKNDPLIRTAVAHYQFEAIHPFGDGNGRTGRILMVLCLMHYGLLELPVLFTSAYIAKTKSEYYKLLLGVTENEQWLPYIEYMLNGFRIQAQASTELLLDIKALHDKTKREIRDKLPKLYSRDMIDAIFSTPVINPTRYGELLHVTYQTGSSHLKQLEEQGFMHSIKVGKYHFFINKPLMSLINKLST